LRRHGAVARVLPLPAPAVEAKTHAREPALGADEHRGDVAHPNVVELDLVKADAQPVEPAASFVAPGRVAHEHLERVPLGKRTTQRDQLPFGRLERVAPKLFVVRPSEPRGPVRLPLGGHARARDRHS
jgi:hypothetical protein